MMTVDEKGRSEVMVIDTDGGEDALRKLQGLCPSTFQEEWRMLP
jgi:hypothetical protein